MDQNITFQWASTYKPDNTYEVPSPISFIKYSIFALIMLSASQQKVNTERIVLHKFANGKPKMVVYVQVGTNEIVYEELYFESGQTNYSGSYRYNVEHGPWKYYWPNGKIKLAETYQNGMEEGSSKHYNEQGKLKKDVIYKKGIVVKEIRY